MYQNSSANVIPPCSGLMSHEDIKKAIQEHEMCITPFDVTKKDSRLTPSGFNFSFSKFIVSVQKKQFYSLYELDNHIYFDILPGDTAVALTSESIWVSNKLAGTFHSKVRFISKGLGHISTTLDPGWQGQLLITINNPSSRKIPIEVGERRNDGSISYNSFITLYLYRLITPATSLSDNHAVRFDTLHEVIIKKPIKGKNPWNKKYRDLLFKFSELRDKYDSLEPLIIDNTKKPNKSQLNKFKTDHEELILILNNLFSQPIKKISEIKKIKRFALIKRILLILIIIIIFIYSLYQLMIRYPNNEPLKWILSFIVVLLGSPILTIAITELRSKMLEDIDV